ncbi:carbohydrate ABC transporter permease [Rhizobium sp. P32RR-XVIII]|uniref:carbohydrate ABC transporter permease n=1 Tax=Rhizobium sp. P32RR-XVIII TaxID=2726738 RepID=UPI0014567D8E|nr:carbohydrate ABC transporter permease [Rhizobium sp. P32RR-XVIII]NLS04178.1 carbohydrate ABC transporter permease [Rhizobium sp. P32RR-XVIII]
MTAIVQSVDTSAPRNREMMDVHYLTSKIMLYLLVLTAVTVIGFPLFWMLICSFKPGGELYATPPTFLPHEWTLQNYRDLFVQTNFLTYFANSLIVAFGATFLSLIVGGLGAYSLSRFNFFGIRAFSSATLICYMLPEVLIVLPLYIYVVKLGMADTLISLIVANTAFTLPLALWFMRSYFNAIPVSLEESAMIDGCTRLGAMMRVTVPLALPGIVSVGVFSFNHAWNEFLFALVFISSETNKTLPLGLATWIGQDNIYSWGMLLSGAVLVTIPVILFYLLVQRKLVVGLSEGGSKGE